MLDVYYTCFEKKIITIKYLKANLPSTNNFGKKYSFLDNDNNNFVSVCGLFGFWKLWLAFPKRLFRNKTLILQKKYYVVYTTSGYG